MGLEKEGAKFRAGQEPAETQVNNVQWTLFLTRPKGEATIGTNDVSVRTNRTDRYENQSVKWLIFSFAKNHPNSIRKGWCLK